MYKNKWLLTMQKALNWNPFADIKENILQLIVLVMCGSVDQSLISCMLVHFLEIYSKVIVGL